MRPAIMLTVVGTVLLAALAAFLVLGAGTTRADSSYDAGYDKQYCNLLPVNWPGGSVPTRDADVAGQSIPGGGDGSDCTTDGNTVAPGITTDQTDTLSLPSGELNFSNITTFGAPGTTITPGGDFPTGTKVGGLRSTINLGLANGSCSTQITADFLLFNMGLPNGAGNPRAVGDGTGTSTNIAYPRPEGSVERYAAWTVGNTWDATTEQNDGDQIADGGDNLNLIADSNEVGIQNYPYYLLNLFDPDYINVPPPGTPTDGPLDPIIPTALYGGITNVAGTWQALFFAQFSEDQVPGLSELDGASGLMTDAMGGGSISILNDVQAVVSTPSGITDFCTLLTVQTMLLGDLPGTAFDRMTTPASEGTGLHLQYAASQRDLDQDGYENQIDSCYKDPNAGSPRDGSDDTDGDGLADECETADFGGGCDPDGAGPLAVVPNDTDSDCFQNRQDNCPVVTNGGPQGSAALNDQKDSEVSEPDEDANADLGPRGDGIGDICDTGPVTFMQNGQSVTINLSPTIANGRYHVATNVVAKCIDTPGGTDLDPDDDGYCTAQDNQETGACKDIGNGGNFVIDSCPVRHKAWSDGSYGTNPALEMDTDGDGFTDAQEQYYGTDATKSCAQTAGAGKDNDEQPLDNHPLDFNDSGNITTADVGNFVAPLNKPVNAVGGGVRYDLNADGITTTADVGFFVSPLNKWCNPSAPAGGGTMGIPPWSQQ